MHKFRAHASKVFTVPAVLFCLVFIFLTALGGLVGGYGFWRTFNVLAEEFKDALIYSRVRLAVGKRK